MELKFPHSPTAEEIEPIAQQVWASMKPPAPLDRIDSRLAEGIPVHVHVDLYNETASMEQHWVLIIGKSGDDYVMNDPWTGKQGSFRASYGDPARWIFRVRVFNNINK